MRKFFALLLALTMVLSLAACGGSGSGGEKSPSVEEIFGLDLESTEEQPMSEERGERDALYAAVKDYFGDMTLFSGSDFEKMTYDDVKELLGVDATYYYYDEDASAQAFIWKTSDYENASMGFWFRDGHLSARGASNMKG